MGEALYRAYSTYLKEKYGEKVYKLPVNLPVTCPNRVHNTGCSFCADIGTGFEALEHTVSVTRQLKTVRTKIENKYKAHKFIAYFQNYTNTFLPLEQLIYYMEEAADIEGVVEICISTRPDCIREDYLKAFAQFETQYNIQVSIELGLQTVNYHTLQQINRGHGLAEFLDAVLRIQKYSFEICVHMILNLPQDNMEDVKEAAKILSALPVTMVKLHSLYIPKQCAMAEEYKAGQLTVCSREEYLERLAQFIVLLRKDIVVERLFSRIPKEDSVFCNWGCSWWKLADEWEHLMRQKKYTQGLYCDYLNGSALNRWEL